ncbi:hypothetical protein [Rhodococcus erythropolis]|uniref:hypothetical protein n=1 Tax=Rhodococcus erythropolis TaxID=1833 RepID=UPI003013BABB
MNPIKSEDELREQLREGSEHRHLLDRMTPDGKERVEMIPIDWAVECMQALKRHHERELVEARREAHDKGFDTCLKYHGKTRKSGRTQKTEDDFEKSGLSKGQVAVIKMQFEKFNATPNEMAKHYGKPLGIMRQIADGRLHSDIKPLTNNQEVQK